MNTRISKS
jgi:hypothetical protein